MVALSPAEAEELVEEYLMRGLPHRLIVRRLMSRGVLDDRRRKVWNVEAAIRKGWVAKDALPSPFRCAPGTGQSVGV